MTSAQLLVATVRRGVGLALAAAGLALVTAAPVAAATGQPVLAPPNSHADFEHEPASPAARRIADWILDSGDNGRTPFVIVDKIDARVFVFDADGRLRGASPALVGLSPGDDSVPGIGRRKMSSIRPEERTTPAGRFVASLERSLHGEEILWVDYDAAVALHPVVVIPNERRLERMASGAPQDRRITYGCINVPAKFFKDVVSTVFRGTSGIVYVLPELRSSGTVFGSYSDREKANPSAAGTAASP
jgi:hypothetical protein